MPPDSSSSVLYLDLAPLETARPAAETLDALVTRLFEQLRLPVYRYLATCCCQPSDAEEIAQDVFLRLYGALAEGLRPVAIEVQGQLMNAFSRVRFANFEPNYSRVNFGKARSTSLPRYLQLGIKVTF